MVLAAPFCIRNRWLHTGLLCALSLAAREALAQARSEGASSVAPGNVDLAAHMREVLAAEEAERCQRALLQAKKKHKDKAAPLPEGCHSPVSSQAAPPPLESPPATPLDTPARAVITLHATPPAQAVGTPADTPQTRAVLLPAPEAPAPDEPALVRNTQSQDQPISVQAAPPELLPQDEPGSSRRALRASDDLLLGGPGLVSNGLTLGGDVAPDAWAIAFTWRSLSDENGTLHNTLLFHLGGAACEGAEPCPFRANALAGFSPEGRGSFPSAATGAVHTDALDWSSLYFGAGLKGRFASGFGLELAAQLQDLSMSYILATEGTAPENHDASLSQLKLSGALSYARGGFELRGYVADNAYVSGAPGQSATAPLHGVFYDPELFGLASGPQGFFGKLEARYQFSFGLSGQLSYGFLSYVGPEWSSAQVLSARVSQELGRFQLALGLTEQLDSLSMAPANQAASQSNTYATGSLAARF